MSYELTGENSTHEALKVYIRNIINKSFRVTPRWEGIAPPPVTLGGRPTIEFMGDVRAYIGAQPLPSTAVSLVAVYVSPIASDSGLWEDAEFYWDSDYEVLGASVLRNTEPTSDDKFSVYDALDDYRMDLYRYHDPKDATASHATLLVSHLYSFVFEHEGNYDTVTFEEGISGS